MEIILRQDIANLGNKNDIITVKNGFARNYLIPKGFAIAATPSAKKIHQENIRQRAHKEEKLRNEAAEYSKKLANIHLTVGAKTSSTGKIFGSVNTIQISEALQAQGYSVERKNIFLEEDAIKQIGKYKAKVKLYKDIEVEINFEVVSE